MLLKDGFIVKNENHLYEIIGNDLNTILELNCDVVFTDLLQFGVLICSNTTNDVVFNEFDIATNLSFSLINVNDRVIIGEGFSNLYDIINTNNGSIDDFLNRSFFI